MTRLAERIATTWMVLSTLALGAQAGATPGGLDPAARQRLARLETPGLESLRAGAPSVRGELQVDVRLRLRQAERAAPELAELRAGATDNDLLLVIAIGVVIIALVVLL
jgi:hypothetical protein